MTDRVSRLQSNLARIRDRIRDAAVRADRPPDSVRLVAVTKYVDVDLCRALAAAGCLDLGESRPQSLWAKAAALRDLPIRWHLVGHLQRNKVRRTLPLVHLFHSVDSLRLLQQLETDAQTLSPPTEVRVLLEINVSGDANKHGIAPGEAPALLEAARAMHHVRVVGLMAMAALDHPGELAREDFRRLRALRDALRPHARPGELDELSMGMSGDFEQAIEEGATWVRIGSALFEGILDD